MGYDNHLLVCLKFSVDYGIRMENLTFLKDRGGQGLIPVVDFSSKCHLGAHAVAKSIFMPHYLLFNHSISNTSAPSPTSACFTCLSPIFHRKCGLGLLRDYVWMLVFNQTKKKEKKKNSGQV